MTEKQALISCIRRALSDESGASPKGEFDWEALYELARYQDVCEIVAAALKELPEWDKNGRAFNEAVNKAVFRESVMHFEMLDIFSRLDSAGIDYFPFKGIVTKNLYPEPWMRNMCDADILVRSEDIDRVRPVFESAGFTYLQRVSVHDAYSSPGDLYQAEVHYELFSDICENRDWGRNIFDRLKPAEPGSRRFVASDEDSFLIYLIHFDKHRQRDECRLSRVLDFWLLPSATGGESIMSEVRRLKLTRAYGLLNGVTRAWRFGERLPLSARGFEKYLTAVRPENLAQYKFDKEARRWQYSTLRSHENGMREFFPSEEFLKKLYPGVAEKHACALSAVRLFHAARLAARYALHWSRILWYRIKGAASPN